MVCFFFWGRLTLPRSWSRYQRLGDDGQFELQANHLNRNPHITLVVELEIATADENWAHYAANPALHSRMR